MSKPLINFNIPKVGRIKTQNILYTSAVFGIMALAWYRGPQIPVVGPYVTKAKVWTRKLVTGS